jgi:hypothetical protein
MAGRQVEPVLGGLRLLSILRLRAKLPASDEARRAFIAWLLQKLTPEARARSLID